MCQHKSKRRVHCTHVKQIDNDKMQTSYHLTELICNCVSVVFVFYSYTPVHVVMKPSSQLCFNFSAGIDISAPKFTFFSRILLMLTMNSSKMSHGHGTKMSGFLTTNHHVDKGRCIEDKSLCIDQQ